MPYVVAVLLGGGLFLTLRLGVVQIRRFPGGRARDVREFARSRARRAVAVPGVRDRALAASIGTGNIAGVATAIISGGPGALFWIWVYGFLATATKFAEAVLGLHFRRLEKDEVLSGPMYYLRDGLKSPGLAWTYALVAGVAALTTTPFTQPNSIAVGDQQRVRRAQLDRRSGRRGAHVARHHRRHLVDRAQRWRSSRR